MLVLIVFTRGRAGVDAADARAHDEVDEVGRARELECAGERQEPHGLGEPAHEG